MNDHALYSKLADYYDRFYWWKDYDKEVDFLTGLFKLYDVRVRDVLEVACGTGNHTKILADRRYNVTGVDLSDDVLRVARRKLRGRATFIQGDMRELAKSVGDRTYDAVVCLFSSISYNTTASDLQKTIGEMRGRARAGGLIIFDTHFTARGFMDGYRGEDIFDDDGVMGARLSTSKRQDDVGEISFSYLISDGPKTIVLRNDVHRLGLFDPPQFREAMREAGLTRLKTFTGWTFGSEGKKEQFGDIIFAGVRPSD